MGIYEDDAAPVTLLLLSHQPGARPKHSLMAELPPEERLPTARNGHSSRTAPEPGNDGMPAGTRLGHIHLHVSRLEQARAELSPLAQLGHEVLESAQLRGMSTEGFVTHDEDGLTVVVVSGLRP